MSQVSRESLAGMLAKQSVIEAAMAAYVNVPNESHEKRIRRALKAAAQVLGDALLQDTAKEALAVEGPRDRWMCAYSLTRPGIWIVMTERDAFDARPRVDPLGLVGLGDACSECLERPGRDCDPCKDPEDYGLDRCVRCNGTGIDRRVA